MQGSTLVRQHRGTQRKLRVWRRPSPARPASEDNNTAGDDDLASPWEEQGRQHWGLRCSVNGPLRIREEEAHRLYFVNSISYLRPRVGASCRCRFCVRRSRESPSLCRQ